MLFFFSFFKNLFLIGRELLCNVVLVHNMYTVLYVCCTTTWVSSKCTYICSLLSLLPSLLAYVFVLFSLTQPAAAFDRWWWICPGPSPWMLFSTDFQIPHSWSSSCFSGWFSASFVDSFLSPWPHLGGPEAQSLDVFSNYIHPLNGFMQSYGCIKPLRACVTQWN